MGIKGEMGAGQSWTKLNTAGRFIVSGTSGTLIPSKLETSADEAELSTKKLGRIICIVAGG